MGWEQIRTRLVPHTCVKPLYDEAKHLEAGTGSTWRCDGCGQVWRIKCFTAKPSDPTDVAVDWVRNDAPLPRTRGL